MSHKQMWGWAGALMVLLSAALSVGADRDQAQTRRQETDSKEMKILDRFAGSWIQETTINAAKWTPTATHANGTMEADWSLNHHFLRAESTCKDADLEEKTFRDLRMLTWDAEHERFQSWYFDSMGFSSHGTGTWDDEKHELTLKSELGHGISMVNTIRFSDDATQEWSLKAKDKQGQVYLDMHGTMTRRDTREAKRDRAEEREVE